MADFDRLYLDTSILRKSNWPHVSAELGFLLELAKNFKIQVVIPEVAEIEREEQWVRDLAAASQKCVAAMTKRAGVLKAVGLTLAEQHRDDSPDALREKYRTAAQSAKDANGIATAPLTNRGVAEFLKLAVTRTPPFQMTGDKVTGFQDTLILLSLIDDLNACGRAICVLLSDDGVFSQISAVSKAEGKAVQHLRTVDDVWKILAGEIEPDLVNWWNDQKAAIQTELEAQHEKISDLLKAFISPDMVDYRVKAVESIGPLHFFVVEMPFPTFPLEPGPYETQEGARFKISATFSTEVRALAVQGLAGLAARLLYGARSGSPATGDKSERTSSETFWKKVEMEGTATFEGGGYTLKDLVIVRLS
jgi:hypothetical protein